MMNNLYILAHEANWHWAKLFKLSFYTREIGKWLIRFITKSKIHHISDNYNTHGCNRLINQSVMPNGYESVDYMDCLPKRDSKIWAYKITAPIDFDLWHRNTLQKRGAPYDYKGAVNTTFDKIFRRKKNDHKESCSETPTWKLMQQGYLSFLDNENTTNPKELINYLIKYGLCDKRPILVWDGEKLINNIFRDDIPGIN